MNKKMGAEQKEKIFKSIHQLVLGADEIISKVNMYDELIKQNFISETKANKE